MATSQRFDLHALSRRDFLKFAAGSLLSLVAIPHLPNTVRMDILADLNRQSLNPTMGRITTTKLNVYDRPTYDAKIIKTFWLDLVLPITQVTLGGDEPSHNRVWYQLNHEGFVHSGSVQPVEVLTNPVDETFPENGFLAELTVPFSDVLYTPKSPQWIAYRLYYSSVYWINGLHRDDNGQLWYSVWDERFKENYYGNPSHFRRLTAEELAPLSPNVAADKKRIEVHIPEQLVIAYENELPVFAARTSTGAKFSNGDFRTRTGRFMTSRKRPSRHMAAGDRAAPNSYDLPGVPWVSYITKSGVAFHGTYWHNDFGKPRSHGCINLYSPDSRWIFRWTLPTVLPEEALHEEMTGTIVDIIG